MDKNNKKFDLFKLLQNIALIGLFLVVGLGTLIATNMLPRTIGAIEITVIIGLLLAGLLLILPWAKYYEHKEYKIVSLVFLISTAVCIVLWEISTLVIFSVIRHDNPNVGVLHLIRITLLISFQVIISSIIGMMIIKYHKKYIPFQAVTYLSMIYIDFWLSTLLFGVAINRGLEVSPAVTSIVFNRTTISLLILAIVYLAVSVGVISNSRRRRVRNTILAHGRIVNRDIGLLDMDDDDESEVKTTQNNDAEAQLEKIKSMYDKGLITKEEYDTKRQEILHKM